MTPFQLRAIFWKIWKYILFISSAILLWCILHCTWEHTEPIFLKHCVSFFTHTQTHTHHPYVFTLIGGPGLSMKFFKGLLFAALKFLSSVFRVKWNMAVWKAFVKQIPPHWMHFNDTFHMQSKILKYVCSCKRKFASVLSAFLMVHRNMKEHQLNSNEH